MASFLLIDRLKLIVLLAAGACMTVCADAQVTSQNLFRRSQFIEYYRLRNQAKIKSLLNSYSGPNTNTMQLSNINQGTSGAFGESVEFELKCNTSPQVHKDWLLAEIHFSFSRWHDAEIVYSSLIRVDSSFCDAYFRLAQSYVAQNNLAGGYNVLTIARRKFPDNPLLNVGLGQLYTLLSYPKTALYYFQKQTILYPKDPDGFLGTSWILAELGRDKEAIFYVDAGRKLLIADLQQAGIASSVAVSIDYLYVFESMLYNRMNQNEKSMETLNNLRSTSNNDDVVAYMRYLRGMYYYNKGEQFNGLAIKNLKKAEHSGILVDQAIIRQLGIRFDPTDFRSIALLEQYNDKLKIESLSAPTLKADSVFDNHLLAEAAELYSNNLATDTANFHALLRLAECYRGLEKHREALSIYQSAVKYYPHEIRLQLLLARQLLQTGEIDQSIVAYNQAVNLDRKDFRGYYGACLAMCHKGEYQKAFDLLGTGEIVGKNNKGKSTILKGILYFEKGFYAKSLEIFSKENVRHNGMGLYYSGLAHHFLGHEDEAADNIFESIRLGAIVSPEIIKMVGLDPKNPQFALH